MNETSKKTRHHGPRVIPTPSEPISKETAKAMGQTWYFTGEVCKRGHVSPRSLINGLCHACARENQKRIYERDPDSCRKRSRDSNIRGVERWGGFVTNDPIRCPRCEEVKPADAFSKSKFRKNGRCDKCKVCVAIGWQEYKATGFYDRRTVKAKATRQQMKIENPKERWAQTTKGTVAGRSKARGETTDITKMWLIENANDVCPLLGIPIKYDNTWMAPDSPAIDRIDNTVGYRQSNCWIISTKANRIKTDATVEEIETVARNFRKFVDQSARDLV